MLENLLRVSLTVQVCDRHSSTLSVSFVFVHIQVWLVVEQGDSLIAVAKHAAYIYCQLWKNAHIQTEITYSTLGQNTRRGSRSILRECLGNNGQRPQQPEEV